MPRPNLGALCLHLERARDHEGSSGTAWWADYWQGSAWPGGGGGGSQRSQISLPSHPKCTKSVQKQCKNGAKAAGSLHLLTKNLPNKIYSKNFSRNTLILKFFIT